MGSMFERAKDETVAEVTKEIGHYTQYAVERLMAILNAFMFGRMYLGDGFAEALTLLSNVYAMNWRETEVVSIQLGNPHDSGGCTIQPCVPLMQYGRVGIALALRNGELMLAQYSTNGRKSPFGADLYCTNARRVDRLVVCDLDAWVKRLEEAEVHFPVKHCPEV